MITISLCLIVKNEEKVLARCLNSAKGAIDEIIIVDTGSTDATKSIAAEFTDKIYDFEWIDDFAVARNFAFSKANMEYILWLDADDVFMPQDLNALLQLKASLSCEVDVVSMPYYLSFDQQGRVTSQLRRNRLVRRARNYRWIGPVHEYLEVYGNVINSNIAVSHQPLSHDSGRNLNIYEQRLLKGEQFSPRDLYYFANELKDHKLYNRAIEYYQRFLATNQGWVEDNIEACAKLADCFYILRDVDNQLKYIYQSFRYSTPRPDFCCRLGFHHLNNNQLEQAIFWYKLATELETPKHAWGMVNVSCQTWLPHLQLCVCYSRAGKYDLAYLHNEKAGEFVPEDPRIHYNRSYLKKLIGEKAKKQE